MERSSYNRIIHYFILFDSAISYDGEKLENVEKQM
jgi:hypothetical protein